MYWFVCASKPRQVPVLDELGSRGDAGRMFRAPYGQPESAAGYATRLSRTLGGLPEALTPSSVRTLPPDAGTGTADAGLTDGIGPTLCWLEPWG